MSDAETREKDRASKVDPGDEHAKEAAVQRELRSGTWQAIACPWCEHYEVARLERSSLIRRVPGCVECGGIGAVRVSLVDLRPARVIPGPVMVDPSGPLAQAAVQAALSGGEIPHD